MSRFMDSAGNSYIRPAGGVKNIIVNPCPFCGGNSEIESSLRWGRFNLAFVSCKSCGAKGPRETSPESAKKAWDELSKSITVYRRINNYEKKREWIRVKNQPPPVGIPVLVENGYGNCEVRELSEEKTWHDNYGNYHGELDEYWYWAELEQDKEHVTMPPYAERAFRNRQRKGRLNRRRLSDRKVKR